MWRKLWPVVLIVAYLGTAVAWVGYLWAHPSKTGRQLIVEMFEKGREK